MFPLISRRSVVTMLAAMVLAATVSAIRAQTLDWGSEVFSDLVDSHGDTLPENVYTFELGAFEVGFVPDESNVDQWVSNWRVFDVAAYNGYDGVSDPVWGYFTSTIQIQDNVTNGSSSFSFAGLSAYIWIRNSDDPVEGTEWLLTRASSWVFPATGGGCCEDDPPIQWSISDLTSGDVPVWGSQGGVSGSGIYTDSGVHTLQTYTFVPEPSSAGFMLLTGAMMAAMRRRITC